VVNAGSERLTRGFGFVGSNVVGLEQHLEAAAIGSDVSLKTPFLAQHAIQQPMIYVRRDTVNLVIRSHDAANMGLLNGRLEGNKERLANRPLGIIAGSGVRASFRLAVDGEVLSCCDNVMAVNIP